MTPLHIEVALHYYNSQSSQAAAHRSRHSNAVARVHHEFQQAGLLEMTDENKHWKATDKLRRYIEALCNVPLSAEENSPYAAILQEENIGDTTVKTRNAKIATVVDKYRTVTPLAKM